MNEQFSQWCPFSMPTLGATNFSIWSLGHLAPKDCKQPSLDY
jgi:hypothetical protein